MRTFGESQVRTAAAADACSGLDALLLQSVFAAASGRDTLGPAGRGASAGGAAVRGDQVQHCLERGLERFCVAFDLGEEQAAL